MNVDTYISRSKLMLEQDATIFEGYAKNHRAKVDGFAKEMEAGPGPERELELRRLTLDTVQKAEANERRAATIREFLAEA